MTDHELDKRTRENIFIEKKCIPSLHCENKIKSSWLGVSSNAFYFPIAANHDPNIWSSSIFVKKQYMRTPERGLKRCVLKRVNCATRTAIIRWIIGFLLFVVVVYLKPWLVFGDTLEMMFNYSVIAISA